MVKYTLKRIANLIPVVLLISVILFVMLKLMPGDPVQSLVPATLKTKEQRDAAYARIEVRLGFDRPYHEQYLMWLKRVVVDRDLGMSTTKNKPVAMVLGEPLKNTFILNLGATIISVVLSIVIGINSAVRRGSSYDKFWQVFTLVGISLPTFFIGLTLIFIFSFNLKWLPSSGMPITIGLSDYEIFIAWVKTLILPTITLTIGSLASLSRYVRTAMIEALSQDYIRTARSKGLSEKVVIYRHAFRNALIPVVTVVAWNIVGMFSGAAITETIFAYNGIGKQFITSIMEQDYDLVMGLNMFYALLMVVGNLLQDLGYALVDPRVRLE